ncbi:MAG: protein-glutamate O-methyltransferase CheR [Calditrichae bacterium]|nr:protein-glutamate O-methyltransferase CheR [Calditrichota bacterium]MCB9056953.1 protein-glutamate O-methyltransferase CheR [Calditrichia bacterium]
MQKITPSELGVLTKYIKEKSGISLDGSKAYLIESRLSPLLQEYNYKNYSELYFKAKVDPRISTKLVDAITTNETFWFRDNTPFQLLKHKIIPDHIDRVTENSIGSPSLKIWSAACSTGQEVYSIAIILKELLGDFSRWRISLTGTDISDAAIAQSSYGCYNKVELSRGLNEAQLQRYFNMNGTKARIKDEIRYIANFKKLNLLEPFDFMGKYDIILCRNVAIYFDLEDRKKLFDRLAKQLNPSGALIIGSTESLFGVSHLYERKMYMNSVFYQVK